MSPRLSKPAVLLIDDTAANRAAFALLLDQDYELTMAASGEEGIRLAGERHFAVILLDVRMPGLDGFRTARVLRQREGTQYVPIVFLSAYDHTPEQLLRGYEAGGTDFLFSPVDENLLKSKVATYASLHMRYVATKEHLERLVGLVADLQTGIREMHPDDAESQARLQRLNRALDVLQRELDSPCVPRF